MEKLPVILTTREVADLLRVHPNTVLHWVKTGEIKPVPSPGRLKRFRREDVERMTGARAA